MSTDVIENYLQKRGIKYHRDYVVDRAENMARVNRYTRAGSKGKIIQCSVCNYRQVVYHFTWASLTCDGCRRLIDKEDFLIDTEGAT